MEQTIIKQKELRLLEWIASNPVTVELQDLEERSGTVVFNVDLEDFEEEDENYGFSLEIHVGYEMVDNGFDHHFGYESVWAVEESWVAHLELRCNDEIVFIDGDSYHTLTENIEIL